MPPVYALIVAAIAFIISPCFVHDPTIDTIAKRVVAGGRTSPRPPAPFAALTRPPRLGHTASMPRSLLAVLALALVAGGALAEQAEEPPDIAGRFVALAQQGDAKGMAALFHYPPAYSEAEREADAEGVAGSLAWLLAALGTPRGAVPRSEPADFYELGVFGGSDEYWASLGPVEEVRLVYDTTFAELGPGHLELLVFRPEASAAPEIRMAAFGIPAGAPGAREKAIDLILGLLESKDTPVPPELRGLLEQELQPSRVAPSD